MAQAEESARAEQPWRDKHVEATGAEVQRADTTAGADTATRRHDLGRPGGKGSGTAVRDPLAGHSESSIGGSMSRRATDTT